jgi:electron transfer flavoprotein alpha subunit
VEERGPSPVDVVSIKSQGQAAGDHELAALGLLEASKKVKDPVLLIGSTRLGRLVAGAVAVLAGMPVMADVRSVSVEGTELRGVRGAYAGKFNASLKAQVPCIALIPQGAYPAAEGSGGKTSEISLTGAPSKLKRKDVESEQKSQTDLRRAKVIVSAGRGFRTKEDLALAERLAKALGGTLGASRPLSSDLGWLGEEYHIGLTGVYVRPDLYLAVGISGQLQHVAGIKDSKIIAAINKDKQAPIFQVADYGVVGDLYLVIPALLKLLGSN